MPKQDPPKQPCADCTRLERKLDAFVTFLCAPLPKCQFCGLLATRLTTIVHQFLGRSEFLCCDKCEPGQAKIPTAELEHRAIGDVERALEINAIVAEGRAANAG